MLLKYNRDEVFIGRKGKRLQETSGLQDKMGMI
jgi:hypothetical protein